MSDIQIRDNAEASRWEAVRDGQVLGFAEYRVEGDTVTMPHTEVHAEGEGIGSQLAKAALDKIKQSGGKVVPQCPFIKGYIDKHPEYQELVA